MTDANSGNQKRRLPKGRHSRKRLSDTKLKGLLLELANPLPSEQLSEETQNTIRALTAVADMENAYKSEKIKELERMVGVSTDEITNSFADKEESRKKQSGCERGE